MDILLQITCKPTLFNFNRLHNAVPGIKDNRLQDFGPRPLGFDILERGSTTELVNNSVWPHTKKEKDREQRPCSLVFERQASHNPKTNAIKQSKWKEAEFGSTESDLMRRESYDSHNRTRHDLQRA
jgi:hypothetical protein